MPPVNWLSRLTDLKPYGAKHGKAPHKPLFLLVTLELAERGELPADRLWLTPELAFRFNSFWQVVAYRRTQPPDVRMPFHHLGTQKFWSPFTESGERSPHRTTTRYIEFDPGFAAALGDPAFRQQARRILIAKHFEPAERNALYHLVGMPVPDDDETALDAAFEAPEDAEKAGREGRFRLDVVSAYNYTCALTGYRVTTLESGGIVDAAHIHQFAKSGNNDPQNGLALCKNAHWLFDAGLWSIDDDYRVLVAVDHFSEESPDQKPLRQYHGQQLRLPKDQRIWPHPNHLHWHRKHRFVGR
jgi:putative restriction endonuclease